MSLMMSAGKFDGRREKIVELLAFLRKTALVGLRRFRASPAGQNGDTLFRNHDSFVLNAFPFDLKNDGSGAIFSLF